MRVVDINSIDKSKLVLVERTGTIKDEKMSTKSIGYYKDAWNRFKRNKAAVVALVLIGIIVSSLFLAHT